VRCEHLYLVGDILDGWRLRKSWYWDAMHEEVLRLILRHARGGACVTYIPGNHDEMFRAWLPLGLEVAGIRLLAEDEHVTADGRRLLVMHGDAFDSVVRYARFLALLGDGAYHAALVLNRWFNLARRRLGYPYWSLSAWLKRQVKEAVKAIDRFESALAGAASTAWSAATSTMPRCATLAACSTSIAATGWRAARRSSNTMTGGWNSWTGRAAGLSFLAPRSLAAA